MIAGVHHCLRSPSGRKYGLSRNPRNPPLGFVAGRRHSEGTLSAPWPFARNRGARSKSGDHSGHRAAGPRGRSARASANGRPLFPLTIGKTCAGNAKRAPAGQSGEPAWPAPVRAKYLSATWLQWGIPSCAQGARKRRVVFLGDGPGSRQESSPGSARDGGRRPGRQGSKGRLPPEKVRLGPLVLRGAPRPRAPRLPQSNSSGGSRGCTSPPQSENLWDIFCRKKSQPPTGSRTFLA